MKTAGCTFLGATLTALVLTPIVAWVARKLDIVDPPGPRKIHSNAVPRIGGVAIVLAMLAPTIVVMALPNLVGAAFRDTQTKIIALLAAACFICIVGLVDDVRGLPARFRFLAQLLAAVVVCAFGIRITALHVGSSFTLELGAFSWPLTILWIVGITNAVNLIDGLDGLAAGICAAACAVIGIFALHTGQPIMSILMAALLGSLVGFLYFNFNPATVFLGDGGTYFLGFMLAGASVLCAAKTSTIVGLALPALALGVPIFDTLFSILRRFLERRSMFAPDRSHIHHLLMDMGLRQRHVVLFLYIITALAAGLGMFMMVTGDLSTLIVFTCVVALFLLVFRIVGSVSFHDTVAGIRRRMRLDRMASEVRRSFEAAELRLRDARSFGDWWGSLCASAADMDLAHLSLALTDRDGTPRTLAWHRPDAEPDPKGMAKLTVPVRDRRAGPSLEAEVVAPVNGSLEAASQLIAYFGRLIDHHSIADLPATPAGSAECGMRSAESRL